MQALIRGFIKSSLLGAIHLMVGQLISKTNYKSCFLLCAITESEAVYHESVF